jgi:hypothetical protein
MFYQPSFLSYMMGRWMPVPKMQPRRKAAALAAFVIGMIATQPVMAASAPEIWQGDYDCAQGVTGLTLTLEVSAAGQAQALFEFHSVPANPTVPTGCFQMSGSLDTAGNLNLLPGAWLLQPPGYVTVGLIGNLDGQILHGTVIGPGCSTFLLTRMPARTQRDDTATCAGVVS